jgi:hypothetical protein
MFGLRLIAGALVAAWTLTGALVLLAYRPGGPLDLVVGAAAGLPALMAVVGLAWPPVARGSRAFAAMVWLGFGSLLLLLPSMGGVATQLQARGPQTLLPSLEAAYPWALALIGTSLFAGLGVARRMLGGNSFRRPRLVRGVALGVMSSAAIASLFASVAVANELALRDRPAPDSRFGPTDPRLEPPICAEPPRAGATARVDALLTASVDTRPTGTVDVRGVRAGGDFRWLAYVATDRALGQFGAARIDREGWRLDPRTGWRRTTAGEVEGMDLDAQLIRVALEAGSRDAAEDYGIEFHEGARARHCRVAIDGAGFRSAFPGVEHLVGDASLERWRGELDYWVFADGEVGRVAGSVNGDAASIGETGLQGTLRATMIAIERDREHAITRPAG